MRKRDKLFVLKYCLNVLKGIFLVLGLMLVVFGLWILLDSNIFFTLLLSADNEHPLALFSHLLLVTSSITVFTGLLGCFGSLHEFRCLVTVYLNLLVLLLGLQSTILALLYTRQEMISTLWKTQLDELISTYGNKNLTEKEHQWAILDDFQQTGCEEDPKIWFGKNIWVLLFINCGLLSVEVLQFLLAAWLLKLMKKTQVLPKN